MTEQLDANLKKLKIQINLELTKEELSHFYSIAQGASLVPYQNQPKAGVAYKEIVKQIEEFLIKDNPKMKKVIEDWKKVIETERQNWPTKVIIEYG